MLNLEKFYASGKYKVTMVNPVYGTTIGFLNSQLKVGTSSSWTSLGDNMAKGSIFDTAMQYTFGRTLTTGAFTHQKWDGQEEIQINFSIAYVAINDAFSEVVNKVTDLLRWPLSPEIGTFMKTPLDVKGGQFCTISSTFFTIKDLLPVSVTPEFSQVLSPSGHPIYATVDLNFKTSKALTGHEVKNWFK